MNDIREALEAAFDEDQEESGGSVAQDTKEPVGVAAKVPTPGEIIDGAGPHGTKESDKSGEIEKPETIDRIPAEKEVVATEAAKPPAGWSPEAREVFKSLPPLAQQEIARREKDFAVGMQRNAESGKFGTSMKSVLAPFQSVMMMEGVDELEAVRGLATTAATLRMGTPTEKASEIARLIKGYGIDIVTLDDILSGQTTGVPEDERKMTALLERHLGPVRQMMGDVERGRAEVGQQVIAEVDREIAEFETTAEFLNEVRNDMADFLEVASKNGRKLTLKEAYDKSVAGHPNLMKIVQERERVSGLKDGQKRLGGKRLAASSISGSSAGSAGTYKPGVDIKSDIAAAWEASERA